MPIRLSGMMSGMDTESIIAQLVSAKSVKVNSVKKSQIKASWKQDAWKSLNTKLQSFQNKYLSNLRFESSYYKKTTKVSDSSVASILTSEKAMNGVQEMSVDALAKTAYMTGGAISKEGDPATALTKMSELGFEANGSIQIKSGSNEVNLDITVDTTISDVLNKLKDAGLNANFDEKQQRFYISAKDSGADSNFTITGTDAEGNGAAAIEKLGLKAGDGENDAKMISGQDARITLNGVQYKSNTNTFDINGLTITANKETAPGEKVTVTTEQDTQGIYDMIKGFLKEYSELVNEMDKLYNADSAKKFEPLLSDEKEALSDEEVEEWEKKIKDSILRRDDNVSAVNSALQQIMMSDFTVNGKKMSLSDFGINTLGYFDADDNQKHALHIDGDPDDEKTMNNADKLKAMIAKDANSVVGFFSQLSQSLYSKMNDLSKSKEGYRSFGYFYDDKKMKSDYNDYAGKISDAEKKLNDYEDRWYKKFSKMETTMAKMQSNANAIAGLFGSGQ